MRQGETIVENSALVESSNPEHMDENSEEVDNLQSNQPADQSLCLDNKSTDMEVV